MNYSNLKFNSPLKQMKGSEIINVWSLMMIEFFLGGSFNLEVKKKAQFTYYVQ